MTTGRPIRTPLATQMMSNEPSVLVVGASRDFIARCWGAAGALGAMVQQSDVPKAATAAARVRPLAIVIFEDLYQFDPDEFDALARDVRASLVVLADEAISEEELTGRFLAALAEAKRLRS